MGEVVEKTALAVEIGEFDASCRARFRSCGAFHESDEYASTMLWTAQVLQRTAIGLLAGSWIVKIKGR
jgi:hypothetical protein